MIQLKSGKISSRTGNILNAIDLVNSTVEGVYKLISGEKDLSEGEKKEVAEVVGMGAVKYSFLSKSPQQNMVFDLEKSIVKEGNSGSYLQYAYARTQSVLRKSKTQNSKPKTIENIKLNDDEVGLMRRLGRFEDVIWDAGKMYSPNLICSYLHNLAQEFNSFYGKRKIVENEFRVRLTEAVGQVLKNGLELLGIGAPEKM